VDVVPFLLFGFPLAGSKGFLRLDFAVRGRAMTSRVDDRRTSDSAVSGQIINLRHPLVRSRDD